MSAREPRKPAAYRLDEVRLSESEEAASPGRPTVEPAPDVFAEAAEALPAVAAPPRRRRRWHFAGILLGAAGGLATLAAGLAVDQLLDALFDRAGWLGWVGAAGLIIVLCRVRLPRAVRLGCIVATLGVMFLLAAQSDMYAMKKVSRKIADPLAAAGEDGADMTGGGASRSSGRAGAMIHLRASARGDLGWTGRLDAMLAEPAQRIGLSLDEIKAELQKLPGGRPPTRADWNRISKTWQSTIDARIEELQRLRGSLTECIGCGCLSLDKCHLTNAADRIARNGPGARFWIGDRRY